MASGGTAKGALRAGEAGWRAQSPAASPLRRLLPIRQRCHEVRCFCYTFSLPEKDSCVDITIACAHHTHKHLF